jgi:type I restriction-modification system DNA methylase subunit
MPKKQKGQQKQKPPKEDKPKVEPDWDVKKWVREFEKLDRAKSTGEKFRDFCEMAYLALAKPYTLDRERQDAMEARYMQIVGTYREKDTVRAYPTFLNQVARNLVYGGCDYLGNIAGELNALNPGQGQYFTPYEVSRLMAKINMYDLDTVAKHPGYFTMYEPCAGSGSIVLAAADEVEYALKPLATTMLVYAADISHLAFWMCYIQLTFRGVAAWVARENSLSLEHFEGAWTPAAFQFLAHHGHLFEKPAQHEAMNDEQLLADLLHQMLDIIDRPPQQMSFFQMMNDE